MPPSSDELNGAIILPVPSWEFRLEMKQEQKKKIANRNNRWGSRDCSPTAQANARKNSSSVEERSVERKLEPTGIETNITQGSKKAGSPNAVGTMTSDSRAGRRTVL